jgi:hypothetical protein
MEMKMDVGSWSAQDAQMYTALRALPEELEGQPLDVTNFRSNFALFRLRSIRNIVEALQVEAENGYCKVEILLSTDYVDGPNTLAFVRLTINEQPADVCRGLSRRLYAKIVNKQPITFQEARNLPDDAIRHLAFRLTDIDRMRLREELAVYNDPKNIPASRLVKSTRVEPTEFNAHVVMGGEDRRFVNIVISNSDEYTITRLQNHGGLFNFMHYLFEKDNINRDIKLEDVKKHVEGCGARNDLTVLVGDCGFNKILKGAFFTTMTGDKIRFKPITTLNTLQFQTVIKLVSNIGS